ETFLIGLDHDLELQPGPDGRCIDTGTGREMADYLASKAPACPVILHTTNAAAAVGMEMVLREAHWETHRGCLSAIWNGFQAIGPGQCKGPSSDPLRQNFNRYPASSPSIHQIDAGILILVSYPSTSNTLPLLPAVLART